MFPNGFFNLLQTFPNSSQTSGDGYPAYLISTFVRILANFSEESGLGWLFIIRAFVANVGVFPPSLLKLLKSLIRPPKSLLRLLVQTPSCRSARKTEIHKEKNGGKIKPNPTQANGPFHSFGSDN
jgi:hypothetical protein